MEGPRAIEGVDFGALAASVRTCSPNVRQRAANDGRDLWYHRALTRFAPSGKRDVVDNAGAGRVVPYTHDRRCPGFPGVRRTRASGNCRRAVGSPTCFLEVERDASGDGSRVPHEPALRVRCRRRLRAIGRGHGDRQNEQGPHRVSPCGQPHVQWRDFRDKMASNVQRLV
jgi:hypothetical protein